VRALNTQHITTYSVSKSLFETALGWSQTEEEYVLVTIRNRYSSLFEFREALKDRIYKLKIMRLLYIWNNIRRWAGNFPTSTHVVAWPAVRADF
jgi:hypothetical protein